MAARWNVGAAMYYPPLPPRPCERCDDNQPNAVAEAPSRRSAPPPESGTRLPFRPLHFALFVDHRGVTPPSAGPPAGPPALRRTEMAPSETAGSRATWRTERLLTCAPTPTLLADAACPGARPVGPLHRRQCHHRRFEQIAAQQRIAATTDPSLPVDVAGLMPARRQTKIRRHLLAASEALRAHQSPS